MANTNTATLNPMDLVDMNHDELKAKANELGVEIEGVDDASDIIAAIVDSQLTSEDVAEEPEVGHLLSLHSKTDQAKSLVLAARNKIIANGVGGKSFRLFLQDRNGNLYTRDAEGVRCSAEKMPAVLSCVSPLRDGSQDQLIQDYKDNPENFQNPLLVRLTRSREGGYSTFVMLYLRKKQSELAEQVF